MHLKKISDQTRLEVLECESAERHIFQPDQSIPCHTMTVHNTLLLVIMYFGQEMIHMIPMTVVNILRVPVIVIIVPSQSQRGSWCDTSLEIHSL